MKEKEHRSFIKFSSKGWGFTKTITSSDKYLGEFWYIVKDSKCPLYFHKIQDKTLYVHSGKIKIFYSRDLAEVKQNLSADGAFGVYRYMESVTLHKGDNFYIPPGCINQIIASEDSEIYLFSTFPVSGDYFELAKGD